MRHLFLSMLFLFAGISGYSQNNGIGIGTTTPHASAAFEIADTSKGILIPRMSMSQRLAIQNPAEGLMVYQTDSIKGYWYFDKLKWNLLMGSTQGSIINGTSMSVFDTSTFWIVPSGINRAIVEAWSGGGGGGGGAENFITCQQIVNSLYAYHTYWYPSGGGGASGSYCKTTIFVNPGDTLQIIVGKGGKGGLVGYDGGNGGASGIFNYFILNGGGGGGKGINNIFPYPIPSSYGQCNTWGFGGLAGNSSNPPNGVILKAQGISGNAGINGKACNGAFNGPDGNSFLVGGLAGNGVTSIHSSGLLPSVNLSAGGNGGAGGRIYNPNCCNNACTNDLSQKGSDGRPGLITIYY